MKNTDTTALNYTSAFADINGLKMYYEIHGAGEPLVLIHGGGSTIETTFGRLIPILSKKYKIIAVELQAHGRTSDRGTPISFEQDADDVFTLLKQLNISKASVFGFSNGGNTALQMAIRHPEMCNKIIAGSVLLKRNGTFPQFWEFMKNGTFEQMPQEYKIAFLKVNSDTTKLHLMYQRCADRMNNFSDFSDDAIKSISCPVILINGSSDVATSEHIVAMSRIIPKCDLTILPGGHGEYLGEITSLNKKTFNPEVIISIIENFLNNPDTKK
ncbi:MAG: alpha/beta hydrolase [Bacteroidia bacterium]|nr:alpha/beta hydrolase [Bacteroidia bacterium]